MSPRSSTETFRRVCALERKHPFRRPPIARSLHQLNRHAQAFFCFQIGVPAVPVLAEAASIHDHLDSRSMRLLEGRFHVLGQHSQMLYAVSVLPDMFFMYRGAPENLDQLDAHRTQ